MLPNILEDVHECIPDLAGSPECARVVAVRKDLSAAAGGAIDQLRNANGEALQTAAQCGRTVGFDEQIDVIPLHAEVQEAKSFSGNSDESFTHGTENVVAPQRRQILTGPERHVDRTVRIVQRPSSMGDAPSPRSGLTSSAFSPAAPNPPAKAWRTGSSSGSRASDGRPHADSSRRYPTGRSRGGRFRRRHV